MTFDKVLSVREADGLLDFVRHRKTSGGGEVIASARLDELIVTALLSSGVRNSEFCSLTVHDTIIGSQESSFVIRGAASRRRKVFVPRAVSDLVERYAREIRPRFLPQALDPGDLAQRLLFNEQRRPFDRTSLYRRVVKILSEVGLGERANVQLLRHTYGYLAYLRTGGNLLFVQRQLGHAHPATTSMYAKLVDESYADLAERVIPGERSLAMPETKARGGRGLRFDCAID